MTPWGTIAPSIVILGRPQAVPGIHPTTHAML
jgi:hypothetical protein